MTEISLEKVLVKQKINTFKRTAFSVNRAARPYSQQSPFRKTTQATTSIAPSARPEATRSRPRHLCLCAASATLALPSASPASVSCIPSKLLANFPIPILATSWCTKEQTRTRRRQGIRKQKPTSPSPSLSGDPARVSYAVHSRRAITSWVQTTVDTAPSYKRNRCECRVLASTPLPLAHTVSPPRYAWQHLGNFGRLSALLSSTAVFRGLRAYLCTTKPVATARRPG